MSSHPNPQQPQQPMSAEQIEGLADTASLHDSSNQQSIETNPENAMQAQSAQRQLQNQQAVSANNTLGAHSNPADSEGNQAIRDAAGNVDTDQLIHNLEDSGNTAPADNPAPFIAPD